MDTKTTCASEASQAHYTQCCADVVKCSTSAHDGTPSSSTGPSSAYDGSYYVYAETNTPNNPGFEFSMYRDFGDDVLARHYAESDHG